ncbi:MAG: aminopeptidase [Tuberibacillus sp.]
MENFQKQLKKYAQLSLKIGINLQKGQDLVIMASIEARDFVREVVRTAYEEGAKNVLVDWGDDQVSRIKYDLAPMEAFKEYPMWRAKGYEEMAANGASFLSVLAPNPELLKGVDPEKISLAQQTSGKAMKAFSEYTMSGKARWSIAAVPTKEWAAKVFPELNSEEGMEQLWEKIFYITRVTTEDPIGSWKNHNQSLHERVDFLNGKQLQSLHYQAPGTDLTIELPDNHLWMGGSTVNPYGVTFTPNIPTEEVFCAPKKTGVNGTVKSTKPLNYGGQLIEGMTFVFENGKIVDYHAESGHEILKKLVETDEGSHYLGEIALVPHDSPISNTDLLFYNTLFDENASCHLAIGAAYAMNLKDASELDDKGLEARGVNTSITHVDFMIGSAELNIDGLTKDGETVALFRNGNWAI